MVPQASQGPYALFSSFPRPLQLVLGTALPAPVDEGCASFQLLPQIQEPAPASLETPRYLGRVGGLCQSPTLELGQGLPDSVQFLDGGSSGCQQLGQGLLLLQGDRWDGRGQQG